MGSYIFLSPKKLTGPEWGLGKGPDSGSKRVVHVLSTPAPTLLENPASLSGEEKTRF